MRRGLAAVAGQTDVNATVRSASLGVGSEVGILHRVIVHRPGPELDRLTPANHAQFLFDDVLWTERAGEEHDALVAALRANGTEVLQLAHLLTETLSGEAARREAIETTLRILPAGPALRATLAAWLLDQSPRELVRTLIGGVTYAELPLAGGDLAAYVSPPEAFVIPPLPNHMFTRDASTWAFRGVSINRMASPARQREALHLDLIYRHHPLFRDRDYVRWAATTGTSGGFEGGDVLVLGNRTLLIGVGERTEPGAVEAYAKCLFDEGAARDVFVLVLPVARSTIHLDTLLSMIDVDAFLVDRSVRTRLDAFHLTPGTTFPRVSPVPDLFAAITRALELPRLRLVESDSYSGRAQREQWDEANNVLALSPGVVIAYERNTNTNARLRAHGIRVVTIPSSELARGRGGPRCLTCPVERAEVRLV